MKLTKSERTKKWKQDNPEKHKEQWLRYYEKHSESIKEKKRMEYKVNKLNRILDDMAGEPTGVFKNGN